MEHRVTLLQNTFVTHDVRRLVLTRPEGFAFTPGQAVALAMDDPEWRDQGRPFSPTGLETDPVLEFTIKTYTDHNGVTARLGALAPGSELLMSAPFGALAYRGPGVFIAGGAGITPFLAMLRRLAADGNLAGHRLLFANKTPADVIAQKELRHLLGEDCTLTCTRDGTPACPTARIDRAFLDQHVGDFDQEFYVCGPPAFDEAVSRALEDLGATPDRLVMEG